MSLQEFYSKYGRDNTHRLLDLTLIQQTENEKKWLHFLKKAKIVGRGTKCARVNIYRHSNPDRRMHIIVRNGKGKFVLTVDYTIDNVEHVMEVMDSEAS